MCELWYRLQVVLRHFNWFSVAVVTSGVSRQERRRVLQQFTSGAIQVGEGPTGQFCRSNLVLCCRFLSVQMQWLAEWTSQHVAVW